MHIMNKLIVTLALLAPMLLISSCNSVKSPTAKSATLANTSWKLVNINGNKMGKRKRPITLSFTDTRASGYSGCNQYFSDYSISNSNDIKFKPIIRTKMRCPRGNMMKRERNYLGKLRATRSFRERGDHLILKGGKGKLRFIKQ
jgi:heat shock protein HslJ